MMQYNDGMFGYVIAKTWCRFPDIALSIPQSFW